MPYSTMRDCPLSFGPVSEGTLQPADLLAAFASILDDVRRDVQRRHDRNDGNPEAQHITYPEAVTLGELIGAAHELTESGDRDSDDWQEAASELVYDATDFLGSILPAGVRVGTLDGDGAAIWIQAHISDDVERSADWPEDDDVNEGGELYVVSDHGNVTFLRHDGARWVEVWAVV